MNNGFEFPVTPELSKLLEDNHGYLLFAAVLTKRRDPAGNNIIDYLYQRRRLNLEDATNAASELSRFVKKDLENLMAAGEESY